MSGMLCQGRSVGNSLSPCPGRPNKPPTNGLNLRLLPKSSMNNSGVTRNGSRYKLRSSNDHFCSPLELQSRKCKGAMSAPNARKSFTQFPPNKRSGSYIDITEGTHKLCKARPKTSLGARGHVGDLPDDNENDQKPKIFLESSASGNNINFTCKIDKRLLQSPTAMAIRIDDMGQPQLDIDNSAPQQNNESHSNKTAVPITNADVSFPDGMASSGTHTFINESMNNLPPKRLSKENMQAFEQSHTPSASQKRSNVERWIEDVHAARQMTSLLQTALRLQRPMRNTLEISATPRSNSTPPHHPTYKHQVQQSHQNKDTPRAGNPYMTQRRLTPGIMSGRDSPAPTELEKRTQQNNNALPSSPEDQMSPVDDKLKKPVRGSSGNKRIENTRFARLKTGRIESTFSNDVYDAFAMRKVKKKMRVPVKKDLKPQMCNSPIVPISEEGCSLM